MTTLADLLTSLRPLLELGDWVRRDEPLAKHTTMKVGGPARLWAAPPDEAALAATLQAIQRAGLPLFVLGNGSNIVASDEGYEGVVLHLGKGFNTCRVEGDLLIAGGAALLPQLTKFALKHSLGNFEWACGVPGSVGGSVWGNAGARGWNGMAFESRDCAADVHQLRVYDRDGNARALGRHEIEFAYRKSSLGELIVAEATFKLRPLSAAEAEERRAIVTELLAKRRATQPVSQASAGCIWKNPLLAGCAGAGQLIEQLGLKSAHVGGAEVSALHGNFVVNGGGASGSDIRALVQHIEEQVARETGAHLEREARFLGR